MEHASVAAFARFTLQLLSLGAPHALVAESVVAWGVAQAPELRSELRACFERELERAERGFRAELATNPLAPGGLVDEATRPALRRAALREVVGPCLDALEQLPPTATARHVSV
jgi:hypothetical protein